jgi:hypothetical protein
MSNVTNANGQFDEMEHRRQAITGHRIFGQASQPRRAKIPSSPRKRESSSVGPQPPPAPRHAMERWHPPLSLIMVSFRTGCTRKSDVSPCCRAFERNADYLPSNHRRADKRSAISLFTIRGSNKSCFSIRGERLHFNYAPYQLKSSIFFRKRTQISHGGALKN